MRKLLSFPLSSHWYSHLRKHQRKPKPRNAMSHCFGLGDLQLRPLYFRRLSDNRPELSKVSLNVRAFYLQVFANVVRVHCEIVHGERQGTDVGYEIVQAPFVEFAGA